MNQRKNFDLNPAKYSSTPTLSLSSPRALKAFGRAHGRGFCPLSHRGRAREGVSDNSVMYFEKLNTTLRTHRTENGFTYIGLLIAVALVGVMLVSVATVWHQALQRENERQLLFVGNQFRLAITSYYENSPGMTKQFPKKLEDLIEDQRTPFVRRYLRRIYYDPITLSTDWGLVKGADQGIIGVYSKSDIEPLKEANFSKHFAMFEDKKHYSDWQFVYAPSMPAVVAVAQIGSVAPAPVAPPAEVIPPEYQPPPLPMVLPKTPDDQKKRLCTIMNRNDLSTCLNLAKKFGDAAGAACLASAGSRFNACLNGDMIPSLIVQY